MIKWFRAEVYLIAEAVLFEFFGLKAERIRDEKTGLKLLSLEKRLRWRINTVPKNYMDCG